MNKLCSVNMENWLHHLHLAFGDHTPLLNIVASILDRKYDKIAIVQHGDVQDRQNRLTTAWRVE